MAGWGAQAWGSSAWGGALAGVPGSEISYFLPPTMRRYPIPGAPRSLNTLLDQQRWHLLGQESGPTAGYFRVNTTDYRTGVWNALTAAQVDELTLAGYGDRIVTVANQGQLPPGLD